jgi:hypothetical protein
MIFAAADLVKYLFGRGRYSPKSLTAAGMQVATKANFAGPKEAPAGNTFFLHYRRSFASWLIMYLTHSTVSHSGLNVGQGYIADVTTAGSKIRPLEEILDAKSWLWDTREIFEDYPREGMDAVAELAKSHVGKKYNWRAAAWIAQQAIFGSNYPRQPRHPRLWIDILILLLLPGLPAFMRKKRPRFLLLAPATVYVLLVMRNELGRLALSRVRRLQHQGRIALMESTYWRKGEPEVRSPGDQMREMKAIRAAQLELGPIPDTPLTRERFRRVPSRYRTEGAEQ